MHIFERTLELSYGKIPDSDTGVVRSGCVPVGACRGTGGGMACFLKLVSRVVFPRVSYTAVQVAFMVMILMAMVVVIVRIIPVDVSSPSMLRSVVPPPRCSRQMVV